jgi:hypothetical protein
VRDNLLLPEIDAEVAAMDTEPVDEATLIISVQQTVEWSNFREQFAKEMYAEYVVAHAELQLE